MATDLNILARVAVAAVPADHTGSPRMHAVQALRRRYLDGGQRVPNVVDLIAAVDHVIDGT